ncbi:MAG: TatD family hydrolase [Candidatus Magasanikbacteria bacterium]|nr:TatD family hydrolase [Candidatus Magasanikbacteria bacterium]
MFDTHCHVQFNGFRNDAETIVRKCGEEKMILNLVGTQKDTSRAGVEMAERFPFTYASIGLHPIHLFSTHIDEEESKFLSREEEFDYEYYKNLGQSKKVIAIGECGLDLYRLPENKTREEVLEKQKQMFALQYKLAQELNVALVLHVREAHTEMIELLKQLMAQYGQQTARGTVHCYTSNWHFAQQYLELGLHIGFTGVITFPPKKNSPQLQLDLLEVVKNCPLEKIVVETDAPYLAPVPYRGQRCDPPMIRETIKKIAQLKQIEFAEVEAATTENAKKLFNISF